ncbi:hypothetical protein QYM36_010597 [Artemia franciscana]|uniref:Uncharacterized protein n=1 Tax=Artemia franciscana TaxID=6661 RepID=A0AA88HVV9_ARTSF|nr:hypothetical protein QYM36_010597 [Artemia franciscana]
MMIKTLAFCLLIALATCRPAKDEPEVTKKVADATKKVEDVKTELKKEAVKVIKNMVEVDDSKNEITPVIKEETNAADETKDVKKEITKEAKPEKQIEDAKADDEKADDLKEEDISETTTEASDTTAAPTTTAKPTRRISGLISGIRKNAANLRNRIKINPFNRRRGSQTKQTDPKTAPAETKDNQPEAKEKVADNVEEKEMPVLPPKESRNVRESITGVAKVIERIM